MALRLTKNIYVVSKLLSRTSHSGFRGQASRQFSEFITKTYGSSQGISVDLLLEVSVIQLQCFDSNLVYEVLNDRM